MNIKVAAFTVSEKPSNTTGNNRDIPTQAVAKFISIKHDEYIRKSLFVYYILKLTSLLYYKAQVCVGWSEYELYGPHVDIVRERSKSLSLI